MTCATPGSLATGRRGVRLDSIARHLGVGAKNGDGKAFAELWRSDRKQAESYLRNDIELTALVANALGITA